MLKSVLRYVLVFYLILSNEASMDRVFPPGPKLIIDHDGGADDSMAIFIALMYEKYFNGPQVIGLTTVHGNVNESQVFVNSQRILDIAKRRDVPIYRGSKRALVTSVASDYFFGNDGLGDLENVNYEALPAENQLAPIALVELSKKYPGDITVMAIGSLTNIAMAIRLDPEFIGRLSQLYVGAGHIYSPMPEFNAKMDVEAYHIVADSAKPDKVTMMPSSQVKLDINLSIKWRLDVLGAIPTKIMKAQNNFARFALAANKVWYSLDPVVAAATLDNNVINEFKYSENSIILCGDERGKNTNNLTSTAPNTRLVYSYNSDYYKDLLIKIFSAEIS